MVLLLLEEVLELQQLLLELLLVEHVWGAPSGASLRQNTGGRGRHRLRGWRLSAQQPLSRGAAAAAAHSFTEPIPPPPPPSPRGHRKQQPVEEVSKPHLPKPAPTLPCQRSPRPAPLPAAGPERAGGRGPFLPLPSLPLPAGTHGAARGLHRSPTAASIFPAGTTTTCPAPLPGRAQAGGPGGPRTARDSPPRSLLRSPQPPTPPFLTPRTEAGVGSPVPREGWEGMDTICPRLGRGNGING